MSRVSTLGQDLVQQTKVVFDRCMSDGYCYNNIICIEDKESGVKLDEEHRLGLNSLKKMIEDDSEIDCVYAYEISRIGRRPEVNYSIRNFLQEHRVQLIILNPSIRLFNENFNYNETDNMLFGIFNSMAENEGFIRKQRLRRGKERSKEMGKWACGRPNIGYVRDKKSGYLIIDEKGAEIVKRVYNEYSEGKSSIEIGRNIVKEGLISERNDICAKKWAMSILKDDSYVGDKVHPRIISDELKEKCDEIRSKFRNKPRETKDNSWCLCKGMLRTLDNRYSYVCSANWGKYCLQSLRCIKIEWADKIVYEFCSELDKNNSSNVSVVKQEYMIELQSCTLKFSNSVSKRKSLLDKKDNVWEKNVEGKISDERAEIMSRRIDGEIEECMVELKSYENEIKRLNELLSGLHDENGELKESVINYNELSVEEKKKVIKRNIIRARLEHVSMYEVIFHFDLVNGDEIVRKYYTRNGKEI